MEILFTIYAHAQQSFSGQCLHSVNIPGFKIQPLFIVNWSDETISILIVL